MRKVSDNLYIIDQRLRYSMISSWNEYLCIEIMNPNDFEISLRGASVLEDARQFFNEEREEYILPEKIDGNCVYGILDGIVFGEPLEIIDHVASPIELNSKNFNEVFDWLEIIDWNTKEISQSILDIVVNKNFSK